MPIELPPLPADAEASILRIVVRTYPHGDRQLEAAVRLGARLGFAAGVAGFQLAKETLNG